MHFYRVLGVRLIAVLFSISIPNALLFAQQNPEVFSIGERVEIYSQILDEKRPILINKPRRYGVSGASFPVMVLLDGEAHFHYTTGVIDFLTINRLIPEMLVVGIPNTDRSRDLTPSSTNAQEQERLPTHGGADDFLKFINEELFPWLNENYQTHPYRILVGHSFGGLFAINSMITNPEVFNAYIAISPSLQWSDQGLVDQAESFFDTTESLTADLFMTAGNEGGSLLGGVRKLSGILDEKAPSGFRWRFTHLPEESHGSVPLRSTYLGLESIFSGWNIPMSDALSMIDTFGVDSIAMIEQAYAESGARFGFDDRKPSDLFVNLAANLLQSNRLDEAVSLLLYDPANYSPPSQLLNLAASRFAEQGEQEKAISLYRDSIEIHPGNQRARDALLDLGEAATPSVRVEVDSNTLISYVGTYDFSPSVSLSVKMEDGRLVRYRNGEGRIELIPVSDSEFYFMNTDMRYKFNPDDEGIVESVTVDQGYIGVTTAPKLND